MGIVNFGRRDSELFSGDGWPEPPWYETSDGGVAIGTKKRSVKISLKTIRAAVGGDERQLVEAVRAAMEKLEDPLWDFDMGPTLAAWERPGGE